MMDQGKREILNRIGTMLLDGLTEEQIVQSILRGEIVAKPPSEEKAREWIREEIEQLDIGDPSKLYKARLQDLYRRALAKNDMKTALVILKELNADTIDNTKNITVQFIK